MNHRQEIDLLFAQYINSNLNHFRFSIFRPIYGYRILFLAKIVTVHILFGSIVLAFIVFLRGLLTRYGGTDIEICFYLLVIVFPLRFYCSSKMRYCPCVIL